MWPKWKRQLVWVTYSIQSESESELQEELPTSRCGAWEDIGVLLPAVAWWEDTGVCWYSGLTDHVGASADGSRADGVDLFRFFALNPLHFPADFTHLSNLLISLFKPAKLMIKITLQTGHIKSWGECEILQEWKCYFICIREKIAAEIPRRNDVYKDTILNGYPPGALLGALFWAATAFSGHYIASNFWLIFCSLILPLVTSQHVHTVFIEYLAIIPVPPLRSKTYPQIAMGSWCSVIYIGNQSRPIFLSPSLSSVFFSDRTAVCRYGWENSC